MAERATSVIDLDQVKLAPVILVKGSEAALADRIVTQIRRLETAQDPATELTEVESANYRPGLLAMLTSPSLFEEPRLVIVDGVEQAGEALAAEILAYIEAPAPDVVLVLRHRGGVQNRRIADRMKKAGLPILVSDPLKSAGDRVRLVADEAKRSNGRVANNAAQALVAAVGSDLHEILGVTRQLVADHSGQVNEEAVREYFAGRLDTSGFEVADAVAAGEGPRALVLSRRAFASKIDPVVVVAALARKMRDLAKVSIPGVSPRDLGMAPWQVDRVRSQARLWDEASLGRAVCLVARADADVKGGSRDPAGAVERCIIEISRARAARA